MKLILLTLSLIWAQLTCAQINLNRKYKHQLEFGLDYINLLNNNSGFNKFPCGGHFGYKGIIKDNHAITINYGRCGILNYPPTPVLGMLGFQFYTLNVGYNYMFPFKTFIFSIGVQLSYRGGGEAAVFGYRDPTSPLSEPVEARLEYNSIGFSSNAEIEYFITKNFGLGVNLNLNYYPFENAKLRGDGTNEPDPLYVQIYKPNNLNFTSTFKLAYKFSFSKTKQ